MYTTICSCITMFNFTFAFVKRTCAFHQLYVCNISNHVTTYFCRVRQYVNNEYVREDGTLGLLCTKIHCKYLILLKKPYWVFEMLKKKYFLLSTFKQVLYVFSISTIKSRLQKGHPITYSNIALINPIFKFLIFDLNFKSTKEKTLKDIFILFPKMPSLNYVIFNMFKRYSSSNVFLYYKSRNYFKTSNDSIFPHVHHFNFD